MNILPKSSQVRKKPPKVMKIWLQELPFYIVAVCAYDVTDKAGMCGTTVYVTSQTFSALP